MVGNYSDLFKHYAGHNILNVASLQPRPEGEEVWSLDIYPQSTEGHS